MLARHYGACVRGFLRYFIVLPTHAPTPTTTPKLVSPDVCPMCLSGGYAPPAPPKRFLKN